MINMPKPYIVHDKYFLKAKQENLRARSAFKLDGIQQRFKLVKPGQILADLGACPGSWSERLVQWIGPKGHIYAFDLQPIDPIAPTVEIHQLDITDAKALVALGMPRLDGVVADLAPKTTGIHDADAYHSAELNHAVLDFCEAYLKKGGYVITKIFQGEEFAEVVRRTKNLFNLVKCFKPDASRDRSRETYIIGTNFR